MLFQGVPRPTAAGDKQNGESAMIPFLQGFTHTHATGVDVSTSLHHAIASVVKGSFGPRRERFRLVAVRPRPYSPPNRQTAVPHPLHRSVQGFLRAPDSSPSSLLACTKNRISPCLTLLPFLLR